MNIKRFLCAKFSPVKAGVCVQKAALMLAFVLMTAAGLPLQAAVMDTVPSCPPDTIPFRENFEAYPASGLASPGVIPDCWDILYGGTNMGYTPHITNAAGWTISNKSLVIYSSDTNTLEIGGANFIVLPTIASDLNGLDISFRAKDCYPGTNNYLFSLGYFEGEIVAENFVLLESFTVTGTASNFQYSLNGRGIPQGVRLAFRQQGGSGMSFYAQTMLDDISINFLPCAPVSDVQVSDVMMTTAHVSWTRGAWEPAWRVEYGERGFTLGTGTVVNTTDPYVDLTGLDGETDYEVYVQAVCDPANLSDISEPVSLRTYCSVRSDTLVTRACDSYQWRDSVYTESGIYFDTVRRASDILCDSIYTLDLTMFYSAYRYDTLVLCQDQLPYDWADTTFEEGSEDGTFFYRGSTIHDCDSTVELALFINPSFYPELYDTICANELPYTWRDTVFGEGTLSGDYIFNRQTQLGCDSIVTLHLVVHEKYEQLELLQVCSHDLPVAWRDTLFQEGSVSGVYTFFRYSQYGCDSIVHLALYVTESDTVLREDTICVSQLPYTWRDTTFGVGTTTGYYLIGGNLSTACESTLLHLVVGGTEADMEHPDTVTICRNDLPYVWHGKLGDYTFGVGTNRGLHRVTVNGGGCTDVYYVFMDVLENGDNDVFDTICSAKLPFTKYDTTFPKGTQSGIYSVTRTNLNGCSKVTTIHLTVNPTQEVYDTLTLCRNELAYPWREWIHVGMTSGDYKYERTTSCGCDSTVYLHLTVNPFYEEEKSLTVCENELPVVWRGHIIPRGTASQDMVFDEATVTGCDSTVTLHLTVNPTYRQEENVTICTGDLPFTWRDTTFDEGTLGGTFLFEKKSVSSCDSVVVLHLTVNPTIEEEFSKDICREDLPFEWGDTTFREGTNSGIYTFHKKTAENCNRTVTLTLNVHESFSGRDTIEVCENDLPVEWRGHVIPRGAVTGEREYKGYTAFGCDSIVILSVVVNPAYHQQEELTICEDELPYTWRDIVFEEGTHSGSFFYEKQSVKGCDSTVMLNLTVNPKYSRTDEVTICDSDLPYTYGDTSFAEGTESGTFVLHRHTVAHACDSVITLHLTVHPTYAIPDELELCESELPYVYGDTVFEAGTESGTFALHRRTHNGCDSTITLSLTIYHRGYLEKEYGICSSELPYVTEDTTFPVGTVSGVYNKLYSTPQGCDSMVVIHLTVRPVYNESTSAVICENDLPYTWRDTTFRSGTRSGVFTFLRSTQSHCDSVVTLALIVNPSYEQEESAEVCDNGFPFAWRDTTFYDGTESGDYIFHRRSISGCDSVVTLHLRVFPTFNQSEQLRVCQNELPYVWRDTTFQTGTVSGNYTFRRSTAAGCDSIVNLALTVYPTYVQNYPLQICSNELPYRWSVTDSTFEEGTVSGTYVFHYSSIHGCDSIIYLHLTVNESYEVVDSLELCQNELPYYYAPGNHTFSTSTSSGPYTFHNSTVSGCDSSLVLYLTIHPSYLQQEMVAVCENEFPFTWRDTTFLEGTTSGTYIFNRTSQFGCDSVVSLLLAISPAPVVSITQIPNGSMTTLVCSSNGNCTYLWSTGEDVTVITVPTDSAATYSVTATNTTTSCTNTASVTIEVGIAENGSVSHDVIVYPNPTDGKVTVSADGAVISEIRVFTMEGRLVRRIKVDDAETELHLDRIAKGSYLLQVQLQQGDIVRKKLIVQ